MPFQAADKKRNAAANDECRRNGNEKHERPPRQQQGKCIAPCEDLYDRQNSGYDEQYDKDRANTGPPREKKRGEDNPNLDCGIWPHYIVGMVWCGIR